MSTRRGILTACLGAVSTAILPGCAVTVSQDRDAQFIASFVQTLGQTVRRPDGTRDEVSIAIAYGYYRHHSGKKDIQASIEDALKTNEITLQQAEDIWTESRAKAQAIIDQGDEAVYKMLIKMVQDRSKHVIHCPHPDPKMRAQGFDFAIVRAEAPKKLGMTSSNPTNTQVCARITELYIQQHGPVPGAQ